VESTELTSEELFERTNAARDAMMGIGIVDDPYPRYHELRARCPVHDGTLSEKFGFTGADGALFPDRRHAVAVAYELVEAVLKDTATFSSAWYDPQLGPSIGRSILHMDPPEHQRHRLVVQPAFSQQEMRWWQSEYVRPTCDLYIDRFVDRGRADLYPEFCVKLPIHVIALALGLPTEDLAWFHANAVKLTTGATRPDEAQQAVRLIDVALRPLVEERRRRPGRDLISVLAHGSVRDEDGTEHGLDDDEILTFCKLLLPAGANTTYRSLGLLLTVLFRHPAELERVRADRSLIPACVEELVRLEHSTSLVGRVCTRDTEVAGRPVAAGDVVLMSLAAANHDPARWPEPEAFDPQRPLVPNLAFGWGRHRCLGVHLARMELVTALDALLDRLPGLRPDPDVEPARISGLMFRAPEHVRAVWD
jgi:cytochrome P450